MSVQYGGRYHRIYRAVPARTKGHVKESLSIFVRSRLDGAKMKYEIMHSNEHNTSNSTKTVSGSVSLKCFK